jgi:enoyl-CoA hydratase/carnithine racemase
MVNSMSGILHRQDIGDGVVVLELDNPPMNAMSGEMLDQAAEAFAAIDADVSKRAVVLTGRGRAFCSGADLKAPRSSPPL